jgi:hypothetical protein
MPRADELPASLANLAHRQALELSPTRFNSDTQRLIRTLDRTIEAQERGRQEAERAAGRYRQQVEQLADAESAPLSASSAATPQRTAPNEVHADLQDAKRTDKGSRVSLALTRFGEFRPGPCVTLPTRSPSAPVQFIDLQRR